MIIKILRKIIAVCFVMIIFLTSSASLDLPATALSLYMGQSGDGRREFITP
jgi:hypothetical protein